MKKIQKMIEAYNKKAKKWEYDEISIENNQINKPFIEKTTIGCSFWEKIKIVYRNGYLKEDYEKIEKALNI
jgi:hypothetical protein